MSATTTMKAKARRLVAAAIVIVPWVFVGVIHLFGGRPVAFRWDGPLFRPKGIGFEFHNVGLLLFVISLVGFLWLLCLLIHWLWISVTSNEKKA